MKVRTLFIVAASLLGVAITQYERFGGEARAGASQAGAPAQTAEPPANFKVRNVAIFIHEGVELLDFAGPGEVFAAARTPQGVRAFKVYTVADSPEPILSQGFVSIRPQYTFDNAPRPDIVVLPGGNTSIPLGNQKVIEWVKRSAQDAELMMSVCTGASLLGRAGLLDGLQVTTHWSAIERLRQNYPKATVHENRRFVDNGKVLTTAGVSAGIDGALHVVERLLGRAAAAGTARYMEYKWTPEAAAAPDGKVHKLYGGNKWKPDEVPEEMKAIGRGRRGHPAGRADVAL